MRPMLGDSFSEWAFAQVDPISAALQTDGINQTATGGTTTTAADFSSVNGVCKPANFPALNAVRELQRQMNRVAKVKGYGAVAVDGAVGPDTLALFRRVQAASAGSVMGDASTCINVAADSDVLGGQVKDLADALGAPATVPDPVTLSVPTVRTKSGKTIAAPDSGVMGSLAMLSPFEKLALAGLAGGIGYLLLSRTKKKESRA